MTILAKTAEWEDYCARCLDIGIQDPTISAGDTYYHFIPTDVDLAAKCCSDCFERLREEVEATP